MGMMPTCLVPGPRDNGTTGPSFGSKLSEAGAKCSQIVIEGWEKDLSLCCYSHPVRSGIFA